MADPTFDFDPGAGDTFDTPKFTPGGAGKRGGGLAAALGQPSAIGQTSVVRPPIATGKPPAPALQTPNQVGSYPGGSLPPAAAAPAAAPASAFAAPKTPEELSGLIAAGRVSTDEEQIGRTMQEAAIAKSKVDTELALEEQKQKANNASREAGVAEDYAAKFKTTADKQKEMLNSSYGYFAPTRESAQDVAGIFSILTLATIGAGTQNKYSGMNALASLTGAMKGYKEGREDIYKKEMASYDKNVAEFSRRTDNSLKEMKLALEELSVDKDAAMARARAVAAADAGSMAALKIRSGDLEGGLKALQHQADVVRTLNEKKAEAERKHDEFKARQSQKDIEDTMLATFRSAQLGQGQQRINIQLGKEDKKQINAPDAVSYVKKFTGSNIDKKVAPELLVQAGAIGDAYGLKAEIEKHPEWVGRTGQVKNFFNRTIESINTGTALPDDNNQPELIFAKRYAEYLVNYERSLAGGAKGFTVAFQNRFNKLLEQNQFNAAGFGALMDEQIRTITNKAASTAPSVTKKNLTDMALDIKTRAGEDDTADAIRSYSSGKPIAAAPTTSSDGTLTQAEKDELAVLKAKHGR